MSTHEVNVIQIDNVTAHPNADALDIIKIGGFQAVVRKGTFQIGDLAVYVEPDYVVPTDREEFQFLKRPNKVAHRLKAVRLRGEISHGLLIPVPDDVHSAYSTFGGVKPGLNVMNDMEIKRWEPEQRLTMAADQIKHIDWPDVGYMGRQKFDIEGEKAAEKWFQPGEPVTVTEKVHGANARYVWVDGKMYVGSRSLWVTSDGDHPWGIALRQRPDIMLWCQDHPGTILYGEVYGKVQSLKYGINGGIEFSAFAALDTTTELPVFMDVPSLIDTFKHYDIDHVPVLYHGPFDINTIRDIAERDSVVAAWHGADNHMMEGVVITPDVERFTRQGQRVAVKVISNRYWEFKD